MLRGVMHLVAALLAPVGFVVLLLIADSPRRYVGASIYATSMLLLYTTSASYHLAPWSARLRGVMKRLDHSMIFVMIAGTYTPFCLVVLDGAWSITMLAIVWTLAAAGVVLKVAWPYAWRWLSVGLYVGMGWSGAIAAAQVVTGMPPAALALLMVGGMFYTVGAVIYAMKKPNPFPRVFGFHEVFHTLVIAGSAVHFVLIAVYIMP
jgi:hemolysin III